jgi:multiple sugar transport system substrate-binding protein
MDGDVIFNKSSASGSPPADNTEIPLDQLPHDLKGDGPVVKPVEPPPPNAPPPPPGRLSAGFVVKIIAAVLGIVIVLVLIFSVVIPFFSRGSNDREVTLTWWGLWESDSTMSVLIRDFEKDHPKIKIKYIKQDPQNYSQKLQAQIGSETGPDIYRYHNTWVPMLRSELAPLPESVITPKAFAQLYYPVIPDDLSSEGPIYGVPLGIDTLTLFINPEITRDFSPPADWIAFTEVARGTTVYGSDGKIETAGAALGSMKNVTHAPDIMSMMMVQNGADLYGETGSERSKRAIASALEFYASFSSGENRVWENTLEPSIEAFAKGRLAMYFGYSWDIFQIRALNPDMQFEVHPVPGISGGSDVSVASYWVEGVSAKSKHQQQAMEFMKYLTQKATVQKFYESAAKSREFGEIYPMPSLGVTLKDNQILYPFVQEATDARSTYFVSDTFDAPIDKQMNDYLADAFNAIMEGKMSAASAVDTLVEGIDAVKKQYNF